MVPQPFVNAFDRLRRRCQPQRDNAPDAALYWEALSDLPIDALDEAALQLARAQKYFPTVSEWATTARALDNIRNLPTQQRCKECAGRGVFMVQYRSGEPFDIAVCACKAGRLYRALGNGVLPLLKQQLKLSDEHRIHWSEWFDGDDA